LDIKGLFKSTLLILLPIIIAGCDHQKKSKKLIPELGNQNDVIAQFWDSPLDALKENNQINAISANLEFKNNSKKLTLRKAKAGDQEAVHTIHELEAKLTDIPIPMQAIPLFSATDQDKQLDTFQELCLGYHSELESDEIIKFYNAEMERLGWQQKGIFVQPEALLIFEKPHKICAISIRSKKNSSATHTCLFIFLGQKKEVS
jgi:hypothetical protein